MKSTDNPTLNKENKKMKLLKLKTTDLAEAAASAGTTPEKFVSDIRSKSLGRRVCAHFVKTSGAYSIFQCQ